MISWYWQDLLPALNCWEQGVSVAEAEQLALRNPDLHILLAAVAWEGYQRSGRGLLLLSIGALEVGDVSALYLSREEFNHQCGSVPVVQEYLLWLDSYEPLTQMLVGTFGVAMPGGGTRLQLYGMNPRPTPPESHRIELQRLAVGARSDTSDRHDVMPFSMKA